MSAVYEIMGTGIAGLDSLLAGIIPGETVVWQVDIPEEYIPFVHRFSATLSRSNLRCTYFRFGPLAPLLPETAPVEVCRLKLDQGFEQCIEDIVPALKKQGPASCAIFDALSFLAVQWYSDRMLANFFTLVSSFLYDLEVTSYFVIQRNRHSPAAISAIHQSAHIIIDIYKHGDVFYLHPIKAYKRFSPTLHMIHRWEDDAVVPITQSTTISEILARVEQPWLDLTIHNLDAWTQAFYEAQQFLYEKAQGAVDDEKESRMTRRLITMAFSRDIPIIKLAEQYIDCATMVEIGKRMIGTGLIGGKAAGMLLAQSILRKSDPQWRMILEVHDSFFIGSDVFYSYLVENDCWWIRHELKTDKDIVDRAEEFQLRIRAGVFPQDIQKQFARMLDYFGQSPIIVRSSSLLEDAYGNAFSGKYESVFCANQGTAQKRLESLMEAAKTVYASTMRKEALVYRKHWGLLDRDEQMSLLVQRVSGSRYGRLYFPHIAGVGFSFNQFVWDKEIDPAKGVLRLVLGLGTRAVERTGDDYTRLVALNVPMKRPIGPGDDTIRFTQKLVDILDLEENKLLTMPFEEVVKIVQPYPFPLELFASIDPVIERYNQERPHAMLFPYQLSLDALLASTRFTAVMSAMLSTLQEAYRHPVDVEFTATFVDDAALYINLVQCRAFQVKSKTRLVTVPQNLEASKIIFVSRGPLIGNSTSERIGRIIYVVPEAYSSLSMAQRYSVARILGQLTHTKPLGEKGGAIQLLMGPGRWGTSTPSLGIPVSFAEINTVSFLCEIAVMHEGLIPDISLGTHFFNDLVEMDMLYLALYPDREGYSLRHDFFMDTPNRLGQYVQEAASWTDSIRVIEPDDFSMYINADTVNQQCICYISEQE